MKECALLVCGGGTQTKDALQEKESLFYKRISKWEDSELEKFIQMLKLLNDNGSHSPPIFPDCE